MIYNIKAIPTSYAGVNFRSRLEARWAAFFDLCGWTWDYEPFDLDGWAPDFLLKGKIKALVEVKPIDFSSDEGAALRQARTKAGKAFSAVDAFRTDNELAEPGDGASDGEIDKYVRALLTPRNDEYEIIIVGNGPFTGDGWCSNWSLGIMAHEVWDCNDYDVADLYYGYDYPIDYAARYGSYGYRIGGQHDGDHHLSPIQDGIPERLWREAGNIVQWKPDNNNRRHRTAA